MTIEYFLQDYALPHAPDDLFAVVVDKGTASTEQLAQLMVESGSTLSVDEIMRTIEEMRCVARRLLKQGYRVVGPLATVAPTIQGMFCDQRDEYDPRRHKPMLIAIPAPSLEEAWQETAAFVKICDREVGSNGGTRKPDTA